MRLLDDVRIRVIRDAMVSGSEPDDVPPDPDADRIEAAVSLIIRAGARLDFLLIKRAEHENDPWSGHMALPGGRWEPTDSGLLGTATRETREETGVDLAAHGVALARLDDVAPGSPTLPRMRIAPFVFAVPGTTEASVVSHELERVHWVPLALLHAPETRSSVHIRLSGVSKSFPSYNLVDEHVWGLTHRILSGFLERFPRHALEGR